MSFHRRVCCGFCGAFHEIITSFLWRQFMLDCCVLLWQVFMCLCVCDGLMVILLLKSAPGVRMSLWCDYLTKAFL